MKEQRSSRVFIQTSIHLRDIIIELRDTDITNEAIERTRRSRVEFNNEE